VTHGSRSHDPLDSLGALLSLAYSGERAAALAYRGHARSLRPGPVRAAIEDIEADELRHRRAVGEMLARLGRQPGAGRELRAWLIGRTLSFLCHVSGALLPLYGAGWLERRNIQEYVAAAEFAAQSGHEPWIEPLLEMAEVEWDHEQFFRRQVQAHWLGKRLALWPEPGPRADIRARFARRHATAPDHA